MPALCVWITLLFRNGSCVALLMIRHSYYYLCAQVVTVREKKGRERAVLNLGRERRGEGREGGREGQR